MTTRSSIEITRDPKRTVRGVDLMDRYRVPAKELGRLTKAGPLK